MKQKNKEDFRRKCRLCGRLGRRFADIFSTPQSKPKKLSRLIFNCLRLKVREDDYLPIKICDDCNRKLASWYTFYKRCQETQKKLQRDFENYFNICCLEYSIEVPPDSDIKNGFYNIYNSIPNILTSVRTEHKFSEFPKSDCRNNDPLPCFISVTDQQKVAEFSEKKSIEVEDVLPHSVTLTNQQKVTEFPKKSLTENSLPELFSSTNEQKVIEFPERNLIGDTLPDLFTSTNEHNVTEFPKMTLTEESLPQLLPTSSDQEGVTEFPDRTFAEDSLSHSLTLSSDGQKVTEFPERNCTENDSLPHLLSSETDINVTEYPERTSLEDSLPQLLTSETKQLDVSEFLEENCKRNYSGPHVHSIATHQAIEVSEETCKTSDSVSLFTSVIDKHEVTEFLNGTCKESDPLLHLLKSNPEQQNVHKSFSKKKTLQKFATPTSKVVQIKHKNVNDKVPVVEVSNKKKVKLDYKSGIIKENEYVKKDNIDELYSSTNISLIGEHSDSLKLRKTIQNIVENETIVKEAIHVPIKYPESMPKQCEVCEKSFTCKVKLRRHIARHRYVAEHQCETCNKLFKTKFTLRCHMLTHSDKRNYCCHICGQLFRTAPCLCNHIKLHSDVKQFVCTLCGKAFRQSNHLDLHNRTHTGERPYHCSECSQGFTTRCKLIRHIQAVHNGAKKYKCMICAKEFLYNNNYKAHLLRHEGQKNIKCEVCGKSFVTNNALLRHRRFHTGEKPFKCDICGQTFADCSNRKRHMIKHQDPKPVPKPRNRRKSMKPPKLDTVMMQDPEIDEVRTYANLRTFLESSEVAETLTSGHCDEDALMNVEYVTLMAANEEDMVTLSSGIQEVITLPEANRISEYELLLKSPLSPETFDGQAIQDSNVFQTANSKNTAISSYQPVDVDSNDLIEVFLTPKTGMIEDKLLEENISLMDKKDETFSKDLESNNLLEVFLESQNNHEPSQGIDISLMEKDETFSSESDETANIIKVLMAHETNTTNKDMKADSFFSLDNLSDQESIIRMLNNQGTTVA